MKEKDLVPLGTATVSRVKELKEQQLLRQQILPVLPPQPAQQLLFKQSTLGHFTPGDKKGSRQVHWTSCLHKTSMCSGPHPTLHPSHHKEIIYCFMLPKASSQKPLLGRMICIRFLIG